MGRFIQERMSKIQIITKPHFYNVSQDSDAYTVRETGVVYNAHFDTKKKVLSMDNGLCLDGNESESIN